MKPLVFTREGKRIATLTPQEGKAGEVFTLGSAAKCDIRASYRAAVPETAPSRRKRFRRPALLRSPESGRHAAAALQRRPGVNDLRF